MAEARATPYGIEAHSLAEIRRLCEHTPGVERLWLFGSRARGDHRTRSDIDLTVDAPGWSAADAVAFDQALHRLPIIYPIDCAWWQDTLSDEFRLRIERDRVVLWPLPEVVKASAAGLGTVDLKPFQEDVLARVRGYLDELQRHAMQSARAVATLNAMEGMEGLAQEAADYPRKTWLALRERGVLPDAFAHLPHSSRFDGAERAIPNVCLKIPTGGGKTLLAAASVGQVFSQWFQRHTGLVLWVVPNDAIYRQTLKTLSDRDHPYRQILNVAGAGRVKILEKTTPLTRQDVDSQLCVMVLMLASAARQSKETLRFFRDRGNVLGFVPREDDIEGHWDLLQAVPNLDVYAPFGGAQQEAARRQKGSIVKTSLGNVMRMLRPMVVIDEGHHGYTENALRTLDGFNPGFLLELSATPRVASAKGSGSNILVDVRGTALDEAQMIKLPIHVDVQAWHDWKSCLAAAVQRLDGLAREAETLQGETSRYIRPILLVQVERTGAEQRESGCIHAEDAREYLLQLGFGESQIAVKTSEKDELKAPENLDLLSPTCEVRAIITKQALQEGWDCPFAYVLAALAAGRNPAAMTQLVGRILRQPQTVKTGREALDACYVLCHDTKTGDVVKAIKRSLEDEGMGDLTLQVSGASASEDRGVKTVKQQRRPEFAALRLFLPRVTWVEADGRRRELEYDSDVLATVDWAGFDGAQWVAGWAPNREAAWGARFDVTLNVLNPRLEGAMAQQPVTQEEARLDRARLVRAVTDIVPNPWLVWDWVDTAATSLLGRGYEEAALAASSASLIEHLRSHLEAERDHRAESVFADGVKRGCIEFALRADRHDYELPTEDLLTLSDAPRLLANQNNMPVGKSLLAPMLEGGGLNGFEAAFAGYLDAKQAVRWWHRNVARTQYGLQGWRRHKVYPDFVFALVNRGAGEHLVLMETKGAHLEGSSDTGYKQKLLNLLSQAYLDKRWQSVGELQLQDGEETVVSCDLLLDRAWQGALEARWFK